MVLSREKRLALEHLGKDAPRAPDVHLDVVLLPREHDFGCSVVSRRDVARHLGVLYTCETEVADLEIAVLVDEDVAGLEIAVHHTSRVDVFQPTLLESASILAHFGGPGRGGGGPLATHQNLVEKVLDKLLLERPRGQQTVEIGSQQLGDEVTELVSVW